MTVLSRCRPAWRGEGFTLVEVLVVMALTTLLAASVLALVAPTTGAFRVQPEVHDLHQRLRGAVEALQRDLYMAGAGTHVSGASGPLRHYLAPIRPYRIGEIRPDPAAGVFHRDDVISLIYVPASVAQAAVRRVSAVGGALAIEAQPNCGQQRPDRVCGFAAGMRVLLFDRGGRSAIGTVRHVDGDTVHVDGAAVGDDVDTAHAVLTEVVAHVYHLGTAADTGVPVLQRYDGRLTDLPAIDHVVDLEFDYLGDAAPPRLLAPVDQTDAAPWTTYGPAPPDVDEDPPDLWGPGENCTFAVAADAHVPRLPQLAGAGLVPLAPGDLTDGPWCPDAAHPERFDADLLRIRRVRVRLRLEAPGWLRGPAGPLFMRGGTASDRDPRVPDVEIRFDVSPRNLSAGR